MPNRESLTPGAPHTRRIASQSTPPFEQSGAVLGGLLAAAPDALLAVEPDGTIVFANDQAEQLFGWSVGELVGRPVETLVPSRFAGHHPGLRDSYMAHPTSRPMGAGLQLWALRRDGSEFPAEISLSSFPTPRGTVVAAAIRDVTQRLALEAERRRLAQDAEREQAQRLESLGQLAGGVAHDFNNLLGVILNYTTLLLAHVTDPTDAEDLGEIRAAAERGAALTKQMLAFARRDVAPSEPVDVNEVVGEVASMLRRTLGEDISLQVDTPAMPLVALVGRHELQQVLLNLALNARDAMSGGGTLSIATAAVDAPGSELPDVSVFVRDSGDGMTPEVMARAFEPFFTTKPRGRGTGLGLATVYGIVRHVGGEVTLDSRVGAGTTVSVRLPGARLAAEEPVADPPDGLPGGSERVLLVEDEPALREGLSRLLGSHGYSVVAAADGIDAIDAVAATERPFDLVLSDLAMPRMGGDELARQLALRGVDVPVMFMSGYDPGETVRSQRLLAKPVTADVLLHAMREVLKG